MSSIVKYLFLFFLSLSVTTVFAADDETPKQKNPYFKPLQKAINNYYACLDKNIDELDKCKKLRDRKEELDQKWMSTTSGASFNQNKCEEDNEALNSALADAKKDCSLVGLSSIPACQKEKQACEADEEEKKPTRFNRRGRQTVKKIKCKSKILIKISEDDKTYKQLKEDAEIVKDVKERLQDNLDAMKQELINKQGELNDAKLAAEQVVRDAAKENSRLAQEAVQQAISIQLEIDKTKFEIEDLVTLKATELAKAKNAVEDAGLDCYEIAINQYNEEYKSCLANKRNKISQGTYSTNSLRGLFSGARPGSCDNSDRRKWYDKYKLDCTQNESHKAKVNRIKQQYKDTAKNIQTTIDRKNVAITKLTEQLETFEKNNSQMNKELLDEQKAALQRATNNVLTIQNDLQLLNQKIFQAESSLRKEQSVEAEIDRNKKIVKEALTENKSNVSAYGTDKIEEVKKYNNAFGSVSDLFGPYNNAEASCCDPAKVHRLCDKIKSTGKSLEAESGSSGSDSN